MTQVELIRLLRQKQADCLEIVNAENLEVEFYTEFYKNNNLVGLTNMTNVDFTDLVTAFVMSCVYCDDRNGAFKYIHSQIEGLRNLIDNASPEDFELIFDTLEQLKQDDYLEEAKILLQDSNKKRGKLNIRKLLLNGILSSDRLDRLYELQDETGCDFGLLIHMYQEAGEVFEEALINVYNLKMLKEDIESTSETLDRLGARKKAKKMFISNTYDTSDIDRDFATMRKYYDQIAAKDRQEKRTAQREAIVYHTLEEKLINALDKDEITDVAKMISKVPDEEIRLEVLKLIYEHNSTYYQALLVEYNKLAENSAIHYQTLLKEYDIDSIDVSTIMNNSLEDVKDILQGLRKINILDPKQITIVLQVTDKETFAKVMSYVDIGILTPAFIKSALLIFDRASDEYNNFIVNIKMFKELGFNPNNLTFSQEIFISSPAIVAKNIEILKQYGFDRSMKKDLDYSFLTSKSLIATLDKMLELGLEKFLEEDLSLLNYSANLDRLRIVHELNIPLDTKDELLAVLTTSKFLVSDELISDYVAMSTREEQEQLIKRTDIPDDLDILKQYQKTSRTYEINGVLISTNRVKRNYSEFNKNACEGNRLLYSILTDSDLTKSNYRTIKETFTESLTHK